MLVPKYAIETWKLKTKQYIACTAPHCYSPQITGFFPLRNVCLAAMQGMEQPVLGLYGVSAPDFV